MSDKSFSRLSAGKVIEKKERSRSSLSSSPTFKGNRDSLRKELKVKEALRSDLNESAAGATEHVDKNGIDKNGVSLSDYADGPGPSDGCSVDGFINPDAPAADYDVKHPTGEKMRDKVRKLLADAMTKPDENILAGGRAEIEAVANAIEAKMYAHFDHSTNASYKTKYRDLNFNLKDPKNVNLRKNVLTRFLALDDLITMSNQELANDELKQTRKKVQDKMTRDAQPSNRPVASTTQFKCGKCKQRKTTYFQMQTRSADEPLTTFVTCVVCGNRWKF